MLLRVTFGFGLLNLELRSTTKLTKKAMLYEFISDILCDGYTMFMHFICIELL